MKNVILLVSISLSVLGCTTYQAVELISVNRVVLNSMTPSSAEFEVDVSIRNPNNYKIHLITKDIKVFLNENFVGTANFKSKVILNEKTQENYTIQLVSSLPADANIDLGTLSASTLLGGLKIKVEGNVKASAKGISKTIPVMFEQKIQL